MEAANDSLYYLACTTRGLSEDLPIIFCVFSGDIIFFSFFFLVFACSWRLPAGLVWLKHYYASDGAILPQKYDTNMCSFYLLTNTASFTVIGFYFKYPIFYKCNCKEVTISWSIFELTNLKCQIQFLCKSNSKRAHERLNSVCKNFVPPWSQNKWSWWKTDMQLND